MFLIVTKFLYRFQCLRVYLYTYTHSLQRRPWFQQIMCITVSISKLEDSSFYLMTVWDALMTLLILAEVLLSISEVW